MTPNDNALFEKWNQWIEIIHNDLRGLLLNRYIYKETQAIVRANPAIHIASIFYEWLAVQYTTTASVGIRRQMDRDNDSISLWRLLNAIKSNPQVLSRERFVRFFAEYNEDLIIEVGGQAVNFGPNNIGSLQYDGLVGEGQPCIPTTQIDSQIAELESKAATIKRYTNKRIAHFDHAEIHDLPPYGDLDDCLDYMEQLLKRYQVLLTGSHHVSIVPTFLFDWKEVLRHAWIPPMGDKNSNE